MGAGIGHQKHENSQKDRARRGSAFDREDAKVGGQGRLRKIINGKIMGAMRVVFHHPLRGRYFREAPSGADQFFTADF